MAKAIEWRQSTFKASEQATSNACREWTPADVIVSMLPSQREHLGACTYSDNVLLGSPLRNTSQNLPDKIPCPRMGAHVRHTERIYG